MRPGSELKGEDLEMEGVVAGRGGDAGESAWDVMGRGWGEGERSIYLSQQGTSGSDFLDLIEGLALPS